MIILLLGPAGSGKTTLCRLLENKYKVIKIYTTREKRTDDKDNYIFVDKPEFLSLYKKKEILTKVKIINNYYGLKTEINDQDIFVAVGDIFTLKQIKRKRIDHIAIFLNIPLSVSERRIQIRGDNLEEIKKKIALERKWGDREKRLCDFIIESYDQKSVYEKVLKIIEDKKQSNRYKGEGGK